MSSLQNRIEARGLEIFELMEGESAAAFSGKRLAGKLLEWAMKNEALKVELFRFVDVLPALRSSPEIARHAMEYLLPVARDLPFAARLGLRLSPLAPWLTAFAARRSVGRMARLFITGSNAREALPVLRDMRRQGIGFTVDILGETVVSEQEAEQYAALYAEMLEQLTRETADWPPMASRDQPHRNVPVVNVSIKVSALHSQIKPQDPEGALSQLEARLLPLFQLAARSGAFVNLDMEHSALKPLTIELFKRLLDRPELKNFHDAGLALQAYHREAAEDFEGLLAWTRSRQRRITIRLVKGAYWDYETIMARQRGWPVPVFEQKAETDANYERLGRRMLENHDVIGSAFGTHSVRSVASCIVHAEECGLGPDAYEFQMLYGMAEPIKHALIKLGYGVRDYCPVGDLIPAMGYLVRRLLENTSNEGFLRATFSERRSRAELLEDPIARLAREHPPRPGAAGGTAAVPGPFQNEPHTDFTVARNREQMRTALELVRERLGRSYPLVLGGKKEFTKELSRSINPARPGEVVGEVAMAGIPEADRAVAAAMKAFAKWRERPVEERAAVWERVADLMASERFHLNALEVFETGKTWPEADADVAEAIDFCRFYAREVRQLAGTHYPVPGEKNIHHYVPRGLALVIAPWNFPLAILTGMVCAASVTGNCVLMKPSGESAVIAAWFMELLERAGMPAGAVNLLPGPGRILGEYLVTHPQVALIAFTGSREVGLRINRLAAETAPNQAQLKKVICEMGGKNALIIDGDADLDEAIPAVIHSAFGYQGQKCSALSRLIVLEGNYARVIERLVEATRSLRIGPPEDPGVSVGPLIDAAAKRRVEEYLELGKREAKLLFCSELPDGPGYFAPPAIFSGVDPGSRLAQEEIFGPILSVLKARTMEEAIAWSNGTPYGLTGGIFSRSPANIQKAAEGMEVGNFYINRAITGALVGRHPFGGFKMSGGGTKAGGRDYLLHFLFPRVITENLLRRGFSGERPAGTGG